MMRFVCPDCGTAFKYPARRVGKAITCGGCGKPHTLPTGQPPAPAAAPLGSTRNRAFRVAVIGLLLIAVAAVGLAYFRALKTGEGKEAAGYEVERQFGDVSPFAGLFPHEVLDKQAMENELKIDLDRPGFGNRFGRAGKLLVLDIPAAKVAKRITGGLTPDRVARSPDEVKFVAHITTPRKHHTAGGYEFGVSLMVYELPTGRLIRVVRFTKTVPEDNPPKELDDGIAEYLNG